MTRYQRSYVTWIAIFAVLIHALLPFAHAAQGPAGVMTTLCSADGNNRLVFIPSDQGDVGDPPMLQPVKCPLCLAGAHYALPEPPALSMAAPTGLRHVQIALGDVTDLLSLTAFPFSARAPPLA